jgi:hypothetical protein
MFSTKLPRVLLVPIMLSPLACSDAGGGDDPGSGSEADTFTIDEVDARRSLAVTDQVILKNFTFERVIKQITNGSSTTPAQLYKQWWGLEKQDDEINGFKVDGRIEAELASTDPFKDNSPDGYEPIGLFNRFDLAESEGKDCGEHRIIFAKRSGMSQSDADAIFKRNFIIFEAVLPNPLADKPTKAERLQGCVPVAHFWATLSRPAFATASKRAQALDDFYFKGLAADGLTFDPVVDADHYGKDGGQVRTNQFVQRQPTDTNNLQPWMLREFHVVRQSSKLSMQAVTVHNNPAPELFSGTSAEAKAFQQVLVEQVTADKLGVTGADAESLFTWDIPEKFLAGQSNAQIDDYRDELAKNQDLQGAIADKLKQESISGLTPDDVVARATALSCGGCHHKATGDDMGGFKFPLSTGGPAGLRFVQVSERDTERGPDGARFQISPALDKVFLPFRRKVLVDFINSNEKQVPGVGRSG